MRLLVAGAGAFALAVLAIPVGTPDAASASEIAFERRTGTGVARLHLVRADGTALRRVATDGAAFDPAWSPDGGRLVFASDRSGSSGAHELVVSDARGRNARRVTERVLTRTRWTTDSAPAWSREGRGIAFVRTEVHGRSARVDLWLVRADGTGLRRLTNTAAPESAPAWDRDRLVYERGGVLYALPIAHGGRPAGRASRVARGTEAAFSPHADGSLALVRDGTVYVWRDEAETRIGAGSNPSWSPDGERIVYAAATGLVSVAADGSGRRRVTTSTGPAHDLAPAWRP